MIIQRIQSLYLLIATVLMAIFCTSSFGIISQEENLAKIYPKDFPVILVVGILVAILLLISIFMFKNLRKQKTVTLVSMLLIVVLGATCCFVIYGQQEGAVLEWAGGVVLLLGALVFALMAYRGMSHDERLLRGSDRIR